MDPDAQLDILREAADAVAKLVQEHPFDEWGRDLGLGADGTSMKLVDDLAEKEILRVLRERGNPFNVVSEGGGELDFGAEKTLVTDPIDGTTNAIRGIPFFCISLAVGTRSISDVETGLVVNLCTGERYEAIRGGGAVRDGKPLRVRAPGRSRLVSTTHGAGSKLEHMGLRSFGASALEMALVAQGALDGYHYPKPILRVTDVAAATLLVREAGGVVLDADGKDLDLPLTLTPRFTLTAAASREMAQSLFGQARGARETGVEE